MTIIRGITFPNRKRTPKYIRHWEYDYCPEDGVAQRACWCAKAQVVLEPVGAPQRQYEPKGASIAHMAELRDKIDAYQSSCTTQYDEPKRNNVTLNKWWDEEVSPKRKRQLEKQIAKEEKAAAAWLAENASKLPKENAGKDGTNIQPYGFFADPVVRIDPDKDENDRTTDEYTQMADVREDQDEEGVKAKAGKETEEPDTDPDAPDPLLVELIDAYEPDFLEKIIQELEATPEPVHEWESYRVKFEWETPLNVAVCAYNEQHKTGDIADVMSGALSSCWSRVERHAALGWKWNEAKGKFVRIQTRGDKEEPPKVMYRRTKKKVRDAVSGQIVEVKVLRFSSDEAVESVRRRWKNNSKITFTIFDITIEHAGVVETIEVHYPTGEIREFSRDTDYALAQFPQRQWRQASAYLKAHGKRYSSRSTRTFYDLWLNGVPLPWSQGYAGCDYEALMAFIAKTYDQSHP